MAALPCTKGVPTAVPGTGAGGGNVSFVSAAAGAAIYARAWIAGVVVAWNKVMTGGTMSFNYPAGSTVDVVAGATVTLNVTVT